MKLHYMVTALICAVCLGSVLFALSHQQADPIDTKADLILIDSMVAFGALERPGVPFPHDSHTTTLEKQGKDCSTCHMTSDDTQSYLFKRAGEIDRETTLEIYHTNCIGCHEDNLNLELASGPVECGECHQRKPAAVARQSLIAFDASMHQRHIVAADNQCDSCHHGYDKEKKELTYDKGKEDSCRTCHLTHLQDGVMSYQEAAHQQCISCHQEATSVSKIENPAVAANQCAGCHDAKILAQLATLDHIPRLDRGQPKTTFVKSLDDMTGQLMDPVLFNHLGHEENVLSCRVCHHNTLDTCETCHTMAGSREGDGVTLAQSMHRITSDRSCTGCHHKEQAASECAGCHTLIKTQKYVPDGRSCTLCHTTSIARLRDDQAAGKELTAERYQTPAAKPPQIDYNALPEEVLIDVIADEYEAVHFPHRGIIEAIMEKVIRNPLAVHFHQGTDVVCQSCHHNSPGVTDPPPKCISCHAASTPDQESQVPGMKAAYHRQCFDCHEAMAIENPVSTDCTACHKKKE